MKAAVNNMGCDNCGERPSDEKLAKMTDAEILAGDWLVDIEDTTFWNRWDEANANLSIAEVNRLQWKRFIERNRKR